MKNQGAHYFGARFGVAATDSAGTWAYVVVLKGVV